MSEKKFYRSPMSLESIYRPKPKPYVPTPPKEVILARENELRWAAGICCYYDVGPDKVPKRKRSTP